eukprot:TRINITY_DN1851_c1_g1_i2.p1 TRINITY_DN1851_c1_g1~~TRINITY_DN1851_c1_g1_i2.p1  ORF type:complete len:221 (+),score=26.47 TRINITY_DN1851_c1_g1_i2:68-664(+)
MLVKALRWPIQSVLAAGALAFSPLFSIVPYVQRKGTFRNANPRECQQSPEAVAELPPWVLRARNAHNNNLEMLGFYAAGIVVAITAGVSPAVIAARATEYVGGRAVYNVVYVAGRPRSRPGATCGRPSSFWGAWRRRRGCGCRPPQRRPCKGGGKVVGSGVSRHGFCWCTVCACVHYCSYVGDTRGHSGIPSRSQQRP